MSENNTEKVSCLSELLLLTANKEIIVNLKKHLKRIFRMTDDNKDYSILYYDMGTSVL